MLCPLGWTHLSQKTAWTHPLPGLCSGHPFSCNTFVPSAKPSLGIEVVARASSRHCPGSVSKQNDYLHFTDEEIEAWRREFIGPRSPAQYAVPSPFGILEVAQGSVEPNLKTAALATLPWASPVCNVVIKTTSDVFCGPGVVKKWMKCPVPSGAHQAL